MNEELIKEAELIPEKLGWPNDEYGSEQNDIKKAYILGATESIRVKNLENEIYHLKEALEISEIEVLKLTYQLNEKRY